MNSQLPTRSSASEVDVELPLQRAGSVDVDLPLVDDAPSPHGQLLVADTVQPTLSQAAANVSVAPVRWPNRSRSGYHGGSDWNWMRDGRAGFGQRSLGGL